MIERSQFDHFGASEQRVEKDPQVQAEIIGIKIEACKDCRYNFGVTER